jgi:hypothetical protein
MHVLFLDAKVLFTAAHNPAGKAAFLFDAADRGRRRLVSNDHAVAEARRNIGIKYPESVARLDILIRALAIVRQPPSGASELDLPEKDQPIYEAARAGRATHLLTGDLRHFGRFMNKPEITGGIVIQTVADYLRGL